MSNKTALKLSDRLMRYSASASLLTAGLLMTSAQPSVAGTSITNVYDPSVGDLDPGESLAIDMDGAGGTEFTMSVFPKGVLGVISSNSLNVMGSIPTSTGAMYPFVLREGEMITYSKTWSTGNVGSWIVMSISGFVGDWINENGSQKGYMGVRFLSESDSSTHYGWIEMTVSSYLNGTPHVIVHRTGIDTPAGVGLPASVELAGAQGASGLQAAAASAFAALGGALTWLRRKLGA